MKTEVFYLIFWKSEIVSFFWITQAKFQSKPACKLKKQAILLCFLLWLQDQDYKGTENGTDQKMHIFRNNSSICWDNDKEGCIFFNLFWRGNWSKCKMMPPTKLNFGPKPLCEIVPRNTLADPRLLKLDHLGLVVWVTTRYSAYVVTRVWKVGFVRPSLFSDPIKRVGFPFSQFLSPFLLIIISPVKIT